MEVMNTQTQDVWLCQQPVTKEQYKALQPPAPIIKSGLGRATFDSAWFLRSPGAAEEGALEAMDISGLGFSRVARLREMRASHDGPTRLVVEKYHVLGFEAGAALHVARLPDGLYSVQQTASASDVPDMDPPDWEVFTLVLDRPWSLTLGGAVPVYFFRNLRSFAGALTAAQLPADFQPLASRTVA